MSRVSKSQTGQVEFEYPLSLVWDHETLAKPIRVHFMLLTPTAAVDAPTPIVGDTLEVRRLEQPQPVIATLTVEYAVGTPQP
jgi:hypothetical protein